MVVTCNCHVTEANSAWPSPVVAAAADDDDGKGKVNVDLYSTLS